MEHRTQTAIKEQKISEQDGTLDTLIVGGGFAGLTAAIYAGRAGLNTLVLEPQIPGGAITTSELVENWPTQSSISGLDLGNLLQKQVEKIGVKIEYGIASQFKQAGNIFWTTLDSGKTLASRTVIYAAGANPRQLGVAGEQEFRGRGVSYCATCDGPFYKQKNVVVIGGGNTAVQEALYLSSLVRSVTIVHRRAAFRADKVLLDRVYAKENIICKTPYTAAEIVGADGALTAVKLKNALTGETDILSCDGVFVYIGIEPNTQMLKGLVQLTEDGFIAAGEDTRTNVAGFFAAGDVRAKELRQLVTAAADGAVAATMAEKYLEGLRI
jgi:thioredoxin reductase (NADPH)